MLDVTSPQPVWDAALGELQIQVNKANYETWLRKTTAISYEHGEFVVGVPSTFVAEYLDRNQRSLVEKVLTGILHKDVKVRFQVSAQHQGTTVSSTSRGRLSPPAQQASLPLFNPKYTFDSFVTGPCNQLAYAAAVNVAQNPGTSYNPLFLYGGAGLGKTHLLQAIGHAAVANNLKVLCVSAEQYTNDLMSALRERQTHELYQKYRSVDMLLVDDVQFFSGKQKTGENFFHTFDELHNASRQIVITSDRPPKAIPLLPERLCSRFEWGLVTEVQSPDFDTRLAILQDKSQQDGVDLSPDVLEFLARQIRENIRVLEGSLNRVVAYAKLVRAMVTPQLAAQAIKDIAGNQPGAPMITAGTIVEAVARSFQLDPSEIVGRKRDKETTMARRVAMYMMRQHTNFSLNQVGKELGGRDAAAVTNSCKKVASDMESNPYLRRKVIDIRQVLGSG
ncbi:MAG: chromosomal replication initiation protein DnaA [Chloroflexi bacterium RBG_16_57_8]|nr:MAG: chromosomal replication initiation protein DnaA [Chloroflexi bacterium RBG_16_57_8]